MFVVCNIVNMNSEKAKDFCVRFTGKNYPAWEFQFRMYVKGNKLWSHLDDVSKAPTEKAALEEWEYKDAQIITWILSSIDPQMINNLRSFSTAQEMWNYLKRIYNQDNAAKRFQLELEIANYKQYNLSVQEFYSGFTCGQNTLLLSMLMFQRLLSRLSKKSTTLVGVINF